MNFWTSFRAESTLARTRTKMRCGMHYCVSTCEKHDWVLNRSHNWWSSPVQSIEWWTASLSTYISPVRSWELILVRPKPENGRQSVISESLNGCQLKHAHPFLGHHHPKPHHSQRNVSWTLPDGEPESPEPVRSLHSCKCFLSGNVAWSVNAHMVCR